MAERRNWPNVLGAAATAVGALGLAFLGASSPPISSDRERDYYRSSTDTSYTSNAPSSQTDKYRDPPSVPVPTIGSPASARSESHAGDILVDNRCDRAMRIQIAYWYGGRWETNGGAEWIIRANDSVHPTIADRRIRPESSEMYFRAVSTDGVFGSAAERQFTIGGRTVAMQEAGAFVDREGHKVIELNCPRAATQ